MTFTKALLSGFVEKSFQKKIYLRVCISNLAILKLYYYLS